MQDNKQKIAARAFAEKWKDPGYEKGESQVFWLELLHNVLGVENPYDIQCVKIIRHLFLNNEIWKILKKVIYLQPNY